MLGHPFDIVQITHGDFSVANLPTYRAVNQLTADPDDVEEFGDCDVLQSLGLTSKVWPRDDDGAAEGVLLRDCGNTDGVIVGARDSRCAFVYGALGDGDTVVHSVDPDASAQVQCKANRQVIAFTKDGSGDNIMINLDGKNNKIQVAGWGGLIEMSKDNGINIVAPDGKCSIVMKDGSIMLVGTVVLGALVPAQQLGAGTAVQIGSVPPVLVPAPNVWVGAPV